MPRAKAAETPAEKAPAKKAPPHPLFPALDAGQIHSLWLYRLVRTTPKARHVAELIAGPIDPAEVTSDAHIIGHGPGVWRLSARAAGGLMLGDPYELRVRDDLGRVPDLVADFERAEEPRGGSGLAAGGEVAVYQQLLKEQREEFARIRAEDKANNDANFAAFGALLDRSVTGFQAMATTLASAAGQRAEGGGAAGGSADWQFFRKELEAERRRTAAEIEARHKLELELVERKARRVSKAEGSGDIGLKDLIEIAPMVANFFKSLPSSAPEAPAAPRVPPPVVIEGVELPSLVYLRAWKADYPSMSYRQGLNADVWAQFEAFHRRGLLPADIAAELGLS